MQKVVREHYLRDDIPCGVAECIACSSYEQHNGYITTVAPILIVDTNIILHQIDILEHEAFQNAVIPSVVLEEVKHRSIKQYGRIRDLIKNNASSKRLHVFANEFHKETFVDAQNDGGAVAETPNDRNDKAIRTVAAFYASHLKGTEPKARVQLLTDDAGNRKAAAASAIDALSVGEWVSMHASKFPELRDMIAEAATDAECAAAEANSVAYAPHFTASLVTARLHQKTLFEGTFTVSAYNCLEASIFACIRGAESEQIFVFGRQNMNRAFHGDRVAVELLPEAQWRAEADADALVESDGEEESSTAAAQGSLRKPTARVVAIIRPQKRDFSGSIDERSAAHCDLLATTQQTVLFTPLDRRIPRIRLRTHSVGRLLHKRIVVRVDCWPETARSPNGHFVRELGAAGELGTETDALLFEHEIAHSPFTAAVAACLPSADWTPNGEDLAGRADFRHLPICSIDPPGCTDIDDALHARLIDDDESPFSGCWEVGVHIADVSHFVAPASAMDEEASRRGTSVYFVDRRIDMLPERLGSDLCSLRANVDRLAFSCVWVMDADAHIVETRFTKSIIASKASFTYEQAQKLLDVPQPGDPLSDAVNRLNAFARILRRRRMEAGALVLSSPEVKFRLSEETKDPLDVAVKGALEANALVEEFMLLANGAVAAKIYDAFPEAAVLRKHPVPPQSNFEALRGALRAYNVDLHSETNLTLGRSLDAIVLPDDAYFNTLVRIMTTRCMMQAVYFAAGSTPPQEFAHYGLAMPIYTHFTSPIRRYADVLVHRLLAAAIGVAPAAALTKSHMDEVCDNLNFRHRMAQYAARSSIELFTRLYFKTQLQQKPLPAEDAYVVKATKNGFVAFVPRFGIEANVRLAADVSDVVVYDADAFCYVKSGAPWIRLLQKVRVCIHVDDVRNRVYLTLESGSV